MDNWERFNEAPLPDKESFYSELNKEGITDDDYVHAQKVWKVFKIKDLGEYYDLYAQTDTLLLADVYEKFRDKWIEIYEIDPAHFLSAPGLTWQACLKKTGIKLELLTDNDMLMMKKKLEKECVMQFVDMLRETINTWRIIILKILYYHT